MSNHFSYVMLQSFGTYGILTMDRCNLWMPSAILCCRELKLLGFDNFECEQRTPNFVSDRIDVLLIEKQRYKAVYLFPFKCLKYTQKDFQKQLGTESLNILIPNLWWYWFYKAFYYVSSGEWLFSYGWVLNKPI